MGTFNMYSKYGKRVFDFLFASSLLVALLPLFIVFSLMIVLLDGLPIFFMQDRIGKNGNVFKIYKFRTMKNDADSSGTVTYKDDSRIIKGGSFIRKFKIDEMVQLLNVVSGDMSIIGPRPTVAYDFNKMNSKQRTRVNVRPGLTGLAQISGNTSLTWPDRIKYDLAYINNISFLSDLKIIFLTFSKVISNSIDSNPPASGEW
mgnify:CR=1 FL=1